jgi:hypothetical protein
MSSGVQRFHKTDAARLLRAWGQATGLPPEQAAITYSLDGRSLTVSAKNPQAVELRADD